MKSVFLKRGGFFVWKYGRRLHDLLQQRQNFIFRVDIFLPNYYSR